MELTELGTYSTEAFLQSAAKYCCKLHSVSLNWISISAKTIQLIGRYEERLLIIVLLLMCPLFIV